MDDAMVEEPFPTEKELQLLAQLKEKEQQVNVLVEDITALRAFLPTQPFPAPSASLQALPPSLLALLTPLLRANPPWGDPSASVVVSRIELLQKENDELYELLKENNVAKLKEEVEMLRQTVGSMETALKESHDTIANLSSELSQAQEALISVGKPATPVPVSMPTQPSNPAVNGAASAMRSPSDISVAKPIPTGPRAQTARRSSGRDQREQSPSRSPITPAGHPGGSGLSVRGAATHELPPRPAYNQRRNSRSRSPDARSSGDRERDRYGDRDPKRRERTPPPPTRRGDNSSGFGGGGDRGRRRHGGNGRRNPGAPVPVESSTGRSLVERLGL